MDENKTQIGENAGAQVQLQPDDGPDSNDVADVAASDAQTEISDENVAQDEPNDDIPEVQPHKFFVYLKNMELKAVKKVQIVSGFLVGVLVMTTLWLTSGSQDQILQWAFIAIFIASVFLQRKIQKESGWNMNTYRFAMIAGMGGILVAMVIEGLVTGKFIA